MAGLRQRYPDQGRWEPAPRAPGYGERLSDLYEGVLASDGELTTIFEPELRP